MAQTLSFHALMLQYPVCLLSTFQGPGLCLSGLIRVGHKHVQLRGGPGNKAVIQSWVCCIEM